MTVDWQTLKPPIGSPHLVVWNESTRADEYRLEGREDVRTVVDLGANVGFFAIRCAELFPEAVIECYEADPANTAAARRNIRAVPIRIGSRIWWTDRAVWSDGQGLELNAGKAGLSWAVGDERDGEVAESDVIGVGTVTLDDVLAPFPEVDLLKCDIEGAEYPVFAAASDETLAKIRSIAFEIHWWEGQPEEVQARFIGRLREHFILDGTVRGSGMLHGTRR